MNPRSRLSGEDGQPASSMTVQIHSFDELKSDFGERPRGKTTAVNSAALNLSVEHGALVVRASETDPGGSVLMNPAATTPVRQITREATIRLTPEDLKTLFAAALAQNLVSLTVDVPTRHLTR